MLILRLTLLRAPSTSFSTSNARAIPAITVPGSANSKVKKAHFFNNRNRIKTLLEVVQVWRNQRIKDLDLLLFNPVSCGSLCVTQRHVLVRDRENQNGQVTRLMTTYSVSEYFLNYQLLIHEWRQTLTALSWYIFRELHVPHKAWHRHCFWVTCSVHENID